MGGQIIATLRLTNTGTQALSFPWVLGHEFGDEAFHGSDALQVALGISAIDAGGRKHDLTGTVLRGSSSRAGTMQVIAAGESIRIRFPGWIPLVDSPMAPVAGDARLFATLILSDGDCRMWAPISTARRS